MRRLGLIAFVALVTSTIAGCFTPQVVKHYDSDCRIEFREMKLNFEQLDAYNNINCTGEKDCLIVVAATLLMTPASAIVSGSIVLVGNSIFWMEHKGRCLQARK